MEQRLSRLESVLDQVTLVVECHSQQVITCVLHDADSHDWANDKQYFEASSYVLLFVRSLFLHLFLSWLLFCYGLFFHIRLGFGQVLHGSP